MNLIKKNHEVLWWKPIVAIDIFFIAITVFVRYFGSTRFQIFSLAGENNVAAWFSSICLFTASLLSYELYSVKKDGSKFSWLIISVLLLGLSFDEIGSVHERLEWSDYIPFALVGGALLIYSLVKLFLRSGTKKSALLIMFAFILFASVALQEYIEHSVNWPYWATGIRVGVEEGTELLGIFLCFLGIMIQRRKHKQIPSIIAFIPNISVMKYLPHILFAGILIHSFMSFFIPYLTDIGHRGNPAIWYPVVVFFILFAESLWKYFETNNGRNKYWLFFSANFLLFSAGLAVLVLFSNFYLLYTLELSIVALFYEKLFEPNSDWHIFVILALILILIAGYIINNLTCQFIISGIFAYTLANICLSRPQIMLEEPQYE
ncbi:MAG: hypothetical protein QNJ72_38840 [Pleurocapsa sp. MO_226.B13]|nr:hypothetical protein [Pleurocapsa sp. MO_226.B13]